MPEQLKQSEVQQGQDPAVKDAAAATIGPQSLFLPAKMQRAWCDSQGKPPRVTCELSETKQWDDETSTDQKLDDFAAIADKLGVCMMSTRREGIGPVARSMAVAKRTGPDFLFLSNANSEKFGDLKTDSDVTLTFQNSSNTDWISVTGKAVTTDKEDPRIKDVYKKTVQAWFGDLGDGVHTGGPGDPRIKLIEVQAKYISYWKHQVAGGIGFATEAVAAVATGGIAKPGVLRQLTSQEVEDSRSKHGKLSS